MNLIDKQHVARFQLDQNGSQIARAVDGRTGGDADVLPHFGRNNTGQAGFAKAGRAVEQNMIQRIMPPKRRADIDGQAVLYLLLAEILAQRARTQRGLNFHILALHFAGYQAFFFHKRPPALTSCRAAPAAPARRFDRFYP